MNFYEEMIKTYDRRIKRIEEDPDPKLLRSTKLLYEAERESCIERLQAWKDNTPFADGASLRGLLAAMGFNSTDSVRAAMRRASKSAPLFETLRAVGLPDDACDLATVPLAMYINGELPVLSLVVVNGPACDPIFQSKNTLARMFNIPLFCIDTALIATYDTIRYCADQLGELIEFAESKVPGVKYDEDKLVELQAKDRQAYDCMRDIYQVRKRIPCPIAGRDSFRSPPLPSRFTNSQKVLEWYRAFRDEILERADRGVSVVVEERLRFLWVAGGPISSNPFEYLEKRGVSIPMYIIGDADKRVMPQAGAYDEENAFGRELTPLERAARMAHTTWGSLGRAWIDDIIFLCKDLKIDGIVNFQQVGCPTTLGLAKSVADAVEKAVGIPTLHIEGRNIDAGSYNQQQFEARLGEFVDVCLARKGTNRA